MSQTQRLQMAHKAIFQDILKHLLTIATEFLKKVIWLPEYPCLAPAKEPGDCGDWTDTTNATDACNKVNLCGRGVRQHVDIQDSAKI